jgi:hypothetical protein
MADNNAYALFVVDPGRTTGVAKALVNCGQPTVASALRRADRKGHIVTYELKTHWYEQAWILARSYFDWIFWINVERGMVPLNNILFVIEDFQVRDLGVDITPIKIIGATEVLIRAAFEGPNPTIQPSNPDFDRRYIKQQPSEQQFCSNEMLHDWTLWRASPHERSALKHMAKRIDRILEGER